MTEMSKSGRVERVYIGGLDPTRLTIQELLHRLQPALQGKVELRGEVSHGKNAAYCHLDAISLDGQDNRTALEIIGKLYNNVTWKGCKIKVQAAKPDFLQRLEAEREEKRRQEQQSQRNEAGTAPGKEPPSPERIPRHLKVKRGYGEESWKVDTKPCRVTDQVSFRKMRNRLISKQQQQPLGSSLQQQQKDHKKGANKHLATTTTMTSRQQAYRWNRAVHLRFHHPHQPQEVLGDKNDGASDAADATATNLRHTRSRSKNECRNDADSSDWTSSSSSTSDGSSTSSEESSDGSDNSEQDEEIPHHQEGQESIPSKERYVWSDTSSEEEGSSSSDDSDAHIDKQPHSMLSSQQEQKGVGPRETTTGNNSDRLVSEEFAAGIETTKMSADDGSGSSDGGKNYSDDDDDDDQDNDDDVDLQQDVQTNLNVLAELFPDLAGTKPAKTAEAAKSTVDSGDDDDHTKAQRYGIDKNATFSAAVATTGWASAGGGGGGQIMLRYDPSKESAGQFLLKDETKTTNDKQQQEVTSSESSIDSDVDMRKGNQKSPSLGIDDDDGESSSDSEILPMKNRDSENDDINEDQNESEELPKNLERTAREDEEPKIENIYEQGKLEQVFRQAREEVTGGGMTTTASFAVASRDRENKSTAAVQLKNNGGGEFSFGFQLDPAATAAAAAATPQPKDTGAFSFSFSIEETEQKGNDDTEKEDRGAANHILSSGAAAKDDSAKDDSTRSLVQTAESREKRRRQGLFFPDSDLDFYVGHFLSLNDGERIAADLEGYTNDPDVQKSWEKQRRILTQDWKRKRKHAQAKRRKRL